MAYKTTSSYTVESDADDEFERLEYPAQTQIRSDVSPSESDGMTSPEHTPTAFGRTRSDGSHISPTALITDWTAPQCADYMRSLGLGQYSDAMIAESINGEALVEMLHQDLKDMGMASVGHRLTVLKGVYDIKVKQNVPLDPDHYVPLSAEATGNEMTATQDDIGRIIESIRLRDQRIIAAESELRAMKEDVNRLIEENRKLREETLPIIRMAKDRSQPLPNPEPAMTTPPADLRVDKLGSGLSRKFSTKRLFLGSAPKNTSPTTLQDSTTLDPSAAAVAASNHLTASLANSQGSPNTIQQLSPTSPAYSVTPSTARQFASPNENYTHYNPRDTTATAMHLAPSSASIAPSTADSNLSQPLPTGSSITSNASRRDPTKPRRERPPTSTTNDDDNIEIFKSFRVSIEDPCHKVLPVALKRYNINDDWRQYALYIVHGDQERCLGLEEKPLLLFKQLDREGRKPMFMLRKHASPAGEGWSGPQSGAAAGSGGGSLGLGAPVGPGGGANGLGGMSRGLPGGVL